MKRLDVVNMAKSMKTHYNVIQIYNNIKPLPRGYILKDNDPWCAGFVSAIFHLCGYDDIAECSCIQMLEKAKKNNIWIESDSYKPTIGDIIMYDWQDSGKGDNVGTPDHTGIIIEVTTKGFIVREGNKNNSIENRFVAFNDKFIRGFIIPPYEKITNKYESVNDIVNGIINGDFGNGDTRKEKLYNYFQKLVNDKLSS